jgi:hypothetical protein
LQSCSMADASRMLRQCTGQVGEMPVSEEEASLAKEDPMKELREIDGGKKYESKEYWDKRCPLDPPRFLPSIDPQIHVLFEISWRLITLFAGRYEISGAATYDWHHTFQGLSGIMEAIIPKEDRTLMLG